MTEPTLITNDDVLTIDTSPTSVSDAEIKTPEHLANQILPVFSDAHPLLHMKLPEYTEPLPNREMTILSKRLLFTMKTYKGIGLSANQCGIDKRVFVIGHEDFSITCINPKILDASPNFNRSNEGCLSFPGLFLKVERPEWVLVEFTDELGQKQNLKLDGITARCFAHELDHMNGLVYTSYVKPLALKMAMQKKDKLIKKVSRLAKKDR